MDSGEDAGRAQLGRLAGGRRVGDRGPALVPEAAAGGLAGDAHGEDHVGDVAAALAAPDDESGERELVAYTDLVLTTHESERAYQWGTLVRTDHRGHRLGLAVKVANVRRLQDTQPQITTVVTFNADVNAPMVAVNERLGFRPVQWLGELQKKL